MSEAAIVLAALFALGMMGMGLIVLVRGAQEASNTPGSWPTWHPTKLS